MTGIGQFPDGTYWMIYHAENRAGFDDYCSYSGPNGNKESRKSIGYAVSNDRVTWTKPKYLFLPHLPPLHLSLSLNHLSISYFVPLLSASSLCFLTPVSHPNNQIISAHDTTKNAADQTIFTSVFYPGYVFIIFIEDQPCLARASVACGLGPSMLGGERKGECGEEER